MRENATGTDTSRMSSLYFPQPLKQELPAGTRVFVSSQGGWRDDCLGFVRGAAETVQTVQGEDYFYWVEFDTPQHDLSEGGPYRKAQVLARYLATVVPS